MQGGARPTSHAWSLKVLLKDHFVDHFASGADPLEVFDASLVPREGLYWAGNHSEVKARQLEELALWDQLPTALRMAKRTWSTV